jgi:acetyl-CoA carboxylase biotin carboxylase subunit
MLAKLIVHGKDRAEAIARGRRALDFFVIEGVKTTIPVHRRILEERDFQEGRLSTRFMERFASAGK